MFISNPLQCTLILFNVMIMMPSSAYPVQIEALIKVNASSENVLNNKSQRKDQIN